MYMNIMNEMRWIIHEMNIWIYDDVRLDMNWNDMDMMRFINRLNIKKIRETTSDSPLKKIKIW